MTDEPRFPVQLVPYVDGCHRREVIALWNSAFAYETAHNRPSLAIDRKLEVQDGLFFVATHRDLVVGTVLAGDDGHRGWLYSVAVDLTHRMRGVGTALVRHAERALVERGCLKINLQIPPATNRWRRSMDHLDTLSSRASAWANASRRTSLMIDRSPDLLLPYR